MIKKKLTWAICIIVIVLYIYFIYNPLIINDAGGISSFTEEKNKQYKVGEVIKVFQKYDFSQDNWKAILIINEREEISSKVPLGTYLETNDKSVLNELKRLEFIYTDSDLATPLNEILLYKNEQLVFRSYIVLDKYNQGLQNSNLGWIKSTDDDLLSLISNFKLKYYPIIFL